MDIKLIADNSTTNIAIEDSNFKLNRAIYGGAVCMHFSGIDSTHMLSFVHSTFESNMACSEGGAVSVRTDQDLEHHDQSNTTTSGHVSFEMCTFHHNSACWGCGVNLYRCRSCGDIILVASSTTWKHNSAWRSSFAVAVAGYHATTRPGDRYSIERIHAKTKLKDCSFIENTNSDNFQDINAIGALSVTSSELEFSGVTVFESNYGTALLMEGLSLEAQSLDR